MDLLASENYLINKAKSATDPSAAKAWIITAKRLYPQNFGIQFEAYKLEKNANNSEEAANCFSYIIQTFQNQPAELWNEVTQLTSALRIPEGATTNEQEFYVSMFQHISYEVQHKILLLTANHSDNNLEHCKLILLLLKRFPQAIHTHSPRLLETLIMNANQPNFREMMVQEALPLLMFKPPDLPAALVNRIMAIVFEYYINYMQSNKEIIVVAPMMSPTALNDISLTQSSSSSTATGTTTTTTNGHYDRISECWRKIFETLELCGRILKWEPYLPYNRELSKDVYWQKLIQIVATISTRATTDNKQILFCATILFVHSLQEYILNVRQKSDDNTIEYILVDDIGSNSVGSIMDMKKRRKIDNNVDGVPHISVRAPCTAETPICFVTAAQCWQLLHSNEILQTDFSKLLRSVPLSSWINRFLIDLAMYLGRSDEAHTLLKDTQFSGNEKHLRLLSLTQSQSTFNIQTFDLLMKILSDMPTTQGQWLTNFDITPTSPPSNTVRNLILLPLTNRAVLQYCTRIIVAALKKKLFSDPTCVNDSMLGNMLVLLQLGWPEEQHLAEQIFTIIRSKGHFIYLQFPTYIICVDMIEEFMSMWYPHGGDVHLEFIPPQPQVGARRIGTRGADKGQKDDFKHIMRQQILKCNDDIEPLIHQFLTQEHMRLVQNLFEK